MATAEFIVRQVIIRLIKIYQLLLSPLLGPRCRFYPSCSEYSLEAIGNHGILKGVIITIKRLAKCHPWHKGGIDMVPTKANQK